MFAQSHFADLKSFDHTDKGSFFSAFHNIPPFSALPQCPRVKPKRLQQFVSVSRFRLSGRRNTFRFYVAVSSTRIFARLRS
jgi:hypothetical protein